MFYPLKKGEETNRCQAFFKSQPHPFTFTDGRWFNASSFRSVELEKCFWVRFSRFWTLNCCFCFLLTAVCLLLLLCF